MSVFTKHVSLNLSYPTKLHGDEDIMETRVWYPLENGTWRPPYFANIHLTNRDCSLACRFCIKQNKFVQERLIEVPYLLDRTLAELLNMNSDNGLFWIKEFHFDGDSSDPLMPRSIPKLVYAINTIKNYALGPKRRVEVITNGVNLLDDQFRMAVPNIDLINVSLNATTAKEHYEISRRDGYFEDHIMKGIKTIAAEKDLYGFNTQINVSHVVHVLPNGKVNLDAVEDMAARLATYGVSKYLFRFDLRGVDDHFRIKIENRLEKVRIAFGEGSSFEVAIKPAMNTQCHDSCVAQLIWLNVLPNGFFGKGCAHNLNSVTATEHYDKKVLTPGDLAMICHNYCPSYMRCQNYTYQEHRSVHFPNFQKKYSELLSIFSGRQLSGAQLPRESVFFNDINIKIDEFSHYLQKEPWSPPERPNITPMKISRDKAHIGWISKSRLLITDTQGNIIGVNIESLQKGRYFEGWSAFWKPGYQNSFELTNGTAILKEYDKEVTTGGKTAEKFLFEKDSDITLPIATVEPSEKERPRIFPDHIRNGNAFLLDRARYFSSYTLTFPSLPQKKLKKLNTFIAQKNIGMDQSAISRYMSQLAQILHLYLLEGDASVDTDINKLAPLTRQACSGTLLDFSYFLSKSNEHAARNPAFYEWFYPRDHFTESSIQYLFWLKCFGRQAAALQSDHPKVLPGDWMPESFLEIMTGELEALTHAGDYDLISYMLFNEHNELKEIDQLLRTLPFLGTSGLH